MGKIGGEEFFCKPFYCVQYDNFPIASDSEENAIKVFSSEGVILYKFEKKGNTPPCFSVDKAGHLMVCDQLNRRVQVFKLSGNFSTKFGTKESGIGKFDLPLSAAVLSDGRIVVSDIGNHRVQIFE